MRTRERCENKCALFVLLLSLVTLEVHAFFTSRASFGINPSAVPCPMLQAQASDGEPQHFSMKMIADLMQEEKRQQDELKETIEVLQLQKELASELGYSSVDELISAMEDIEENEEGGLEGFIAEIERETDVQGDPDES